MAERGRKGRKSGGILAWFRSRNKGKLSPVDLKRPICLDESGCDPYGKDVFGTYDLNGRKKAEEKDVDQLIKDHSIFPKAMAYNLPP